MLFQRGLDAFLFSLSLLDFLLLLLQKFGGDAGHVVLGAAQQVPQLGQEDPGVLGVQEPRQVDLHVLGVWMPDFKLIIDKFYDDIIFNSQEICDALCNPWFQTVSIHFCHIHLLLQSISKPH